MNLIAQLMCWLMLMHNRSTVDMRVQYAKQSASVPTVHIPRAPTREQSR